MYCEGIFHAIQHIHDARLLISHAIQPPIAAGILKHFKIFAWLKELCFHGWGKHICLASALPAPHHLIHLPGLHKPFSGFYRCLNGNAALNAQRSGADIFNLIGAHIAEPIIPANIRLCPIIRHPQNPGPALIQIALYIPMAICRGTAGHNMPAQICPCAIARLIEHGAPYFLPESHMQFVQIIPGL